MKRTEGQNRRFWALISKLGIDEETRKSLVLQYTKGRTEHSSEMTRLEMEALLQDLGLLAGASEEQAKDCRQEPAINKKDAGKSQQSRRRENEIKQRKRRMIFRLFYRLGWIEPSWDTDRKLKVINDWLWRRAGLEKHLNELEVKELNKVIKQLNIVIENYEKDLQAGASEEQDLQAGASKEQALMNRADVESSSVSGRMVIRIGYMMYLEGFFPMYPIILN